MSQEARAPDRDDSSSQAGAGARGLEHDPSAVPLSPLLLIRGAFGGLLMGLANLVPGISGGTMLLATGVYPRFIGAVAEVTTLRLRLPSLALLGSIAGTAALGILLLAGLMKGLVVEHRWAMYSLFIGLTLGGVPIVWRLARPPSPGVFVGAAAGLVVMLAMAFGSEPAAAPGRSDPLLFLAGISGAAAMILPGVSGGYLLLLLGQYLPILGAVDLFKQALLARPTDLGLALEAARVLVPVGLGVVAGVVGVSNLVRWLLRRLEKPTLGVLLGLLLGAVAGLWPFQEGVPLEAGDTYRGEVLSAEQAADLDPEHWPVRYFQPAPAPAATSAALILAGFAATLLIGRLDPDRR